MAASIRLNKLVQLFFSFTLGILCACLIKRIVITKQQKVSFYVTNFSASALILFCLKFLNSIKMHLKQYIDAQSVLQLVY